MHLPEREGFATTSVFVTVTQFSETKFLNFDRHALRAGTAPTATFVFQYFRLLFGAQQNKRSKQTAAGQ
jgi:hypothetical protein